MKSYLPLKGSALLTHPGTFIIDVEAEMFRSKSGTISEYCGGNLEMA